MKGVDILTSMQVVTESVFNWEEFRLWALFTIGICVVVGGIISLFHKSTDAICAFIVLGLIIGSIMGAIAAFNNKKITGQETHYQVVISDEVSMNEFLSRYEIIDIDGKIFTIKERSHDK